MPLASFLEPVKIIRPSDLGGGLAAPPPKKIANVPMTCQEEDNWCWASVTQLIEEWKSQQLSQSQIASEHVDPNAQGMACVYPLETGDSGLLCKGCNQQGCAQPHSLGVVLGERGRLSNKGDVNDPVTFSDIKTAIDAGRPLPLRIAWDDDNAHFICVTGYATDLAGEEWVTLFDPLLPGVAAGRADEQRMRFSILSTAYPSKDGGTGVPDWYYEVH